MITEFENIIKKYDMNITGVIHVGAHHGEEISTYMKMKIKDIVLFEPLEENFKIIEQKTHGINGFTNTKIRKYQVALGNDDKIVKMNLSNNELESSSILKPKEHLNLYPGIVFDRVQEVQMKKLDGYNCEKCNFLNVDVQGYELEVLKGAKETLRHIEYVYCEVNQKEVYENNAFIEEIDDYLSSYGIKRVETFWWYNDGWGDALYIKESALLE